MQGESKQSNPSRQQKKKYKSLGHAKKACLGKIQHRSMLAAQYIFDRMYGNGSHLLEIYKCSYCKTFHIGHNKAKEAEFKRK